MGITYRLRYPRELPQTIVVQGQHHFTPTRLKPDGTKPVQTEGI
jgi:hypothetical protein